MTLVILPTPELRPILTGKASRLLDKIPTIYRHIAEERWQNEYLRATTGLPTRTPIDRKGWHRRGNAAGIEFLGMLTDGIAERKILDSDESQIGDLAREQYAMPGNEAWWRRHLRRIRRRGREAVAIRLGLLGSYQPYASNDALAERRTQHAAQLAWMAKMMLTTPTGEAVSLLQAWIAGPSCPDKQAAELAVRAYGMVRDELERGREPWFATITTPSRYHRSSGRWDGSLPDQSNAWLSARMKEFQDDREVREQGFSALVVREPHKDGTAHGHILGFADAPEVMHERLRTYWLGGDDCDGDEPGADVHRVKFEPVHPTPDNFSAYDENGAELVGDARRQEYVRRATVGYLVKYITKHTTGLDTHDNQNNDDNHNLTARVEAWASTWGVRRFSFIGDCGVSAWRRLRRYGAERLRLAGERPGEGAVVTDIAHLLTGEITAETGNASRMHGALIGAINAAISNDWQGYRTIRREYHLGILRAQHADDDAITPFSLSPGRAVGVVINRKRQYHDEDEAEGTAVKLLTERRFWTLTPGQIRPLAEVKHNEPREGSERSQAPALPLSEAVTDRKKTADIFALAYQEYIEALKLEAALQRIEAIDFDAELRAWLAA